MMNSTLPADDRVSEVRARTINTLREIAEAMQSAQLAETLEILGSIGPDETDDRPSASQVTGVAMDRLDAWYASHELQNGVARVQQRDIPRSIWNITPDLEALARKGRAYRSTDSLLKRNPEPAVAGAGAYMVGATLAAATSRNEPFDAVLDELLPAQHVPARDNGTIPAAAAAHTDERAAGFDTLKDDRRERYSAIVETRFIAGVKEFQQWLGASHPVTGTGLPKRADIKAVAATIGIDVEGVAKKQEPAQTPESDVDLNVPAQPQPTRYVQSAQAIPELMAFMIALQEVELLEVLSTKVQPGTQTQDFEFEDVGQLGAAEQLVATYVRETLTYGAEADAAAQTAQFLLDATAPDASDITVPELTLIPRLRQLEAMELLEIHDGTPSIRAPLHQAVGTGLQQIAQ